MMKKSRVCSRKLTRQLGLKDLIAPNCIIVVSLSYLVIFGLISGFCIFRDLAVMTPALQDTPFSRAHIHNSQSEFVRSLYYK